MTFKVQDYYFKKAKKENFLARSVYKLEEIDKKFKVLGPKKVVLDLGYYPGSWIQYTSKVIGPKGIVVGVDIQEINPKLKVLNNVQLFQKDVFQISAPEELGLNEPIDVLLSDMAPSTTGIKSVDQARSLNLVEKVFELMDKLLVPKGNIVVKVFDGPGAHDYLKTHKNRFEEFHFLRPKSTRSVSKEFFVIGLGFKA